MSDTKALSKFNVDLEHAILESLKAFLEPPADEDGNPVLDGDGNPDWTSYNVFIENTHTNVMNHVRELVANLGAFSPKVSVKASAAKPKKGEKKTGRTNTYTQWVRVASHIRKGATDGDREFVVGDNFTNKTTPSASNYLVMKDDLGLDGETMSVKALLTRLKDSMPDEKDLTLTAICWGLMPKEFRDRLVEDLDTPSV